MLLSFAGVVARAALHPVRGEALRAAAGAIFAQHAEEQGRLAPSSDSQDTRETPASTRETPESTRESLVPEGEDRP